MADLPWGDERTQQFITNVGLITTTGPHGPNIMAAEWTHHVSYSPGLIAVCISPSHATHENIRATNEFGVSICATEQNVLSSVSGGYSGRDVDKIKALEALGFRFSKAQHIKPSLVKDAAVNIECKLVNEIPLGDHTMFVGEVLRATRSPAKKPLALHDGRYWRMTDPLDKPSEKERERIRQTVERFRKRG